MQEMSIPKVECIGIADNYGRFRIAPLETGYGLTLGNALRRIMLSSLDGAAITSVQIEGVYHEFASLPGVKEDVTDIILNLKKLRVRSYSEKPVTLRIDTNGARKVTAADIRPHAEVDVVSVDTPIATLDRDDAEFRMELIVGRGRGFVPAEEQDELPIGMIALDAIYSPVTKSNYVVERTRVGQKTDYDMLVIEVWTDGTIAPGEALSQSARILVEQSQVIASYAQGEAEFPSVQVYRPPITPEAEAQSISDIGLGSRTENTLKRARLETVGEVLAKSKRDLLTIRNFGEKSLDELQERLQAIGYFPASMPEHFLMTANDEFVPIGSLGQSNENYTIQLGEGPDGMNSDDEDDEDDVLEAAADADSESSEEHA